MELSDYNSSAKKDGRESGYVKTAVYMYVRKVYK